MVKSDSLSAVREYRHVTSSIIKNKDFLNCQVGEEHHAEFLFSEWIVIFRKNSVTRVVEYICDNTRILSLTYPDPESSLSEVKPVQVSFSNLLRPQLQISGSLRCQSHAGQHTLFHHYLPQMSNVIQVFPSPLDFFLLSNCPFKLDFPLSSQLHANTFLSPSLSCLLYRHVPIRDPDLLSIYLLLCIYHLSIKCVSSRKQ